jgi:hypothetical protein
MAVIVTTNFEGVATIADIGFGAYPATHDSVVEQPNPNIEVVNGIGLAGSRGARPLSTLDSGSKALAFMFRIDPDYGHSGTLQCQVKNTYYNGYAGTWQNGGLQALHWNTALPGDQRAGYGEPLILVSLASPGADFSTPARHVFVQIAVSPATYAAPETHGLPAGSTPAGDGQQLYWVLAMDPPPLATAWVTLRATFTTSTMSAGTPLPDGRFCVSCNGIEVLAASHITLGAAWGDTLGGTVPGAPPAEPRNPSNIWNAVQVNPAGEIDALYVSSDYEACVEGGPPPPNGNGNGNGGGTGGGDTDAPPHVAPSYHLDARYIRRLRRAPHVAQENKRLFYRSFELDLERGQGLATGQGSDPMVVLRISRDGGQTWGEASRMAAGALGAYTQRVIARRLGSARDTVFEVTVSDPIAWSLVDAWLDLEAGTS